VDCGSDLGYLEIEDKVVFDKVLLRDPGSVVGLMTYWMINWAFLQKTSV
jgi:hypothetical protein